MIYNLPRKKKAAGETWVINETPTIKNDTELSFTHSFISNSESFNSLQVGGKRPWGTDQGVKYDSTYVYYVTEDLFHSAGWTNAAYRTITLTSPATGDFLTWLEANAVKQ